jgi:hypothetical protein
MKFKMAATAGLRLTLDPMGKMFQNASSLKPLGQLKPNRQFEFHTGTKNVKFVEDHPMNIHGENVSKRFFSETTRTDETKLPRNDHWKVLYRICSFRFDPLTNMSATGNSCFRLVDF